MNSIKNIITVFFLIIALYFVGFICILYRHAFSNASIEVKMNILKNSKTMYLLTPLLFWVASRSFLFKHANGPLNSNIHNLFKNIDYPNYFKTDFPFTSILAVIASSLIAIYAGGALGPETPLVYMSMVLLLYAYSFFKNTFKSVSSELNFESLLYLGYVFGITILFRSPLASFILSIEKSLHEGSSNILSNIIYCCLGILVAYSITNHITNDKTGDLFKYISLSNLFKNISVKFDNNIIHIVQYLFLAVICGIVASVLMKTMTLLFYGVQYLVNKSKLLLHFIPILFGLCVATMINYSNNPTRIVGTGINMVNCELNESCTYNINTLFQFIYNVIFTFISGCSGGHKFIFMSIGSGIGSLYDNISSVPHINSIIVGITAFFSTIFGNPISSTLIIMKTTNLSYDSLPILAAVSLVSYYTFNYFINYENRNIEN